MRTCYKVTYFSDTIVYDLLIAPWQKVSMVCLAIGLNCLTLHAESQYKGEKCDLPR
ncbi:hypothetical protein HMPREF1869_00015 [Bacteroidales bacterium KA00251]|nr:hypothetical protein HMPREF1869_00015 [Bacteroidales bacterium KA00251]